MCAMLVTLGESLTINGRRAALLHRATSSISMPASVPNAIPPCFVFGQDTFNS
jgi:hypothetical protein